MGYNQLIEIRSHLTYLIAQIKKQKKANQDVQQLEILQQELRNIKEIIKESNSPFKPLYEIIKDIEEQKDAGFTEKVKLLEKVEKIVEAEKRVMNENRKLIYRNVVTFDYVEYLNLLFTLFLQNNSERNVSDNFVVELKVNLFNDEQVLQEPSLPVIMSFYTGKDSKPFTLADLSILMEALSNLSDLSSDFELSNVWNKGSKILVKTTHPKAKEVLRCVEALQSAHVKQAVVVVAENNTYTQKANLEQELIPATLDEIKAYLLDKLNNERKGGKLVRDFLKDKLILGTNAQASVISLGKRFDYNEQVMQMGTRSDQDYNQERNKVIQELIAAINSILGEELNAEILIDLSQSPMA